MSLGLVLGLQVVRRHHVQFPTIVAAVLFQQLGSQTHVLAVTADRLCQVAGFNGDIHGAVIFIYHDRRDVGRRHGVDDELRWIIIPQDDVDAFAAELARHGLNARTAHTYAGADRIDALVVGFHCNFRTGAWIAGCRFNLDHFFADFRHFDAEQLFQHFRAGTADEQLRAAGFRTHSVQYAANAVARTEVFARQHVFTANHRFGVVAQIQRNAVTVHFLHHAGDDLTFVFTESVDHHRALGLAHFLHDNLLGGLGGDAVEGHGFDLIFDVAAELDARIFKLSGFQRDFTRRLRHFVYGDPTAEGIEIAGSAVNADAHVDFLLVFFLGCGG
ncbi:Uncharacterised protein [Acinetobacter baumannii]|nr:Uncharacterised protein [Acinetobacter baumannii]